MIEVGKTAPDFILKDQDEKEVKLSEYKGKKVLLSWHPLAWTSICAAQMAALEENFARLAALNIIPLGLSVDSFACKKAWASVLSIKKLRLLADFWPHGDVSSQYGVFFNKFGFSKRANVLIDERGIVVWSKEYPTKQLPDLEEIINFVNKK